MKEYLLSVTPWDHNRFDLWPITTKLATCGGVFYTDRPEGEPSPRIGAVPDAVAQALFGPFRDRMMGVYRVSLPIPLETEAMP